jgi:hypothetical protein
LKQINKLGHFLLLLVIILILGCDFKLPQIANDPPSSEFSFGFKGRLEKLEDAFYSANLQYKEFNYSTNWQKDPEYEFTIIRADTILNYIVILQDCQSIYYLVKWNDDWKCDSSYIHIDKYSSNLDSIPKDIAKAIFDEEIIAPLRQRFNSVINSYHWKIEKSNDTTYVKILNQNDSIRKLYIYSLDTIGNSIAEKEIFNYLGDSTVYYKKSQSQMFMYLESKKVILHKSKSH